MIAIKTTYMVLQYTIAGTYTSFFTTELQNSTQLVTAVKISVTSR